MAFHHHVLPNGLQIIGETHPAMRSVAIGFSVRTGARDETPAESGVSHFLEHMVFKGTERRSAFEVNRDLDAIGSHSNAYTSEERTVYHATLLPEYLPRAIDILADILRPSLRLEDFTMEKQVILEEIGRYEDQPSHVAYEAAKNLYFDRHPLANSILGTTQSVSSLSREQMRDYFARRYVGSNITVAAAGRFDWKEFVDLIRRHCSAWPAGHAPRKGLRQAKGTHGFAVVPRANVIQEHVVLLSQGPPADSPLRHAAETLAVALGDDSGSRLYWTLVDPGLVDSADSNFFDYEGTGTFVTGFNCDPAKTRKNLALTRGVLQAVQRTGLTQEELDQARSKILSALVRGSERPWGRMHSISWSWSYLGAYRSLDDELAAYEAVSLKSIRKLLDRYPLDHTTILALGPLKKLTLPAPARAG